MKLIFKINILIIILIFGTEVNFFTGPTSARIVRKSAQSPMQQFSEYVGEDNAQEILKELEKLGFSQGEINQGVKKIIEFIEMGDIPKVPPGWWTELVDKNLATLFIFPRLVALDSGKKDYLLTRPDYRKKREIFNNKSIVGLVGYFERTSEEELKNKFPELKSINFNDVDRVYIMQRALKTSPETAIEWRQKQKQLGSNFNWRELKYESPQIETKLVELIAKEKIFPQLMEENPKFKYYSLDTFVPLYLLSTRSLVRFLYGIFVTQYGGKDIINFKRDVKAYPSQDNIHYGKYYRYLWIDYIRNSIVYWSKQEVPKSVIEHLVLRVAQERGKTLRSLIRKDFKKLDFLRYMVWDEDNINYRKKGVVRMIEGGPYYGMRDFRKRLIMPLAEKIRNEVDNIKREFSEEGKVKDWSKYSVWARKTYLEKEILNGKDWRELNKSELPEGFLEAFPIKDLNFVKAMLWVDLDLYERIAVHLITTEDWVTKLLWGEDIDWGKTPIGVREDWVRMLAKQENMSVVEILSQPACSNIWDKKINFKSDPLGIFSNTFERLLPFMPKREASKDWTLRPILEEAYDGDMKKLRKDLLKKYIEQEFLSPLKQEDKEILISEFIENMSLSKPAGSVFEPELVKFKGKKGFESLTEHELKEFGKAVESQFKQVNLNILKILSKYISYPYSLSTAKKAQAAYSKLLLLVSDFANGKFESNPEKFEIDTSGVGYIFKYNGESVYVELLSHKTDGRNPFIEFSFGNQQYPTKKMSLKLFFNTQSNQIKLQIENHWIEQIYSFDGRTQELQNLVVNGPEQLANSEFFQILVESVEDTIKKFYYP